MGEDDFDFSGVPLCWEDAPLTINEDVQPAKRDVVWPSDIQTYFESEDHRLEKMVCEAISDSPYDYSNWSNFVIPEGSLYSNDDMLDQFQ
jgi:hypothetical protein